MPTEYRTHSMRCPRCNSSGIVPIFDLLDLSESSESTRKMALSGKLFRFECQKCGKKELISYPMTCLDEETSSMFNVIDDGEDRAQRYKKTCLIYEEMIEQFGYTCRMVSTCQEISEKLRMFEDRIDDRVIEILKVIISESMADSSEELAQISCLYKNLRSGKIIFIITYGKERFEFEVPTKEYAQVEENLEKIHDRRLMESYIINERWAYKALAQLNSQMSSALSSES